MHTVIVNQRTETMRYEWDTVIGKILQAGLQAKPRFIPTFRATDSLVARVPLGDPMVVGRTLTCFPGRSSPRASPIDTVCGGIRANSACVWRENSDVALHPNHGSPMTPDHRNPVQ